MGVIYFVQGCRSGLVKIGRATNFPSRLSAIRSQSPEPIRVLGIGEVDHPAEVEAMLHQAFAAERHHGEWFRPSAAMLGFINRNATVPEDEWSPRFCQLVNGQRRFEGLFPAIAA